MSKEEKAAAIAEIQKKAREKELKHFMNHEVYEKALEVERWVATGKGPIGTRWLDANEGT